MKIILARDQNEPLLMRYEQSNPMAITSTHNLITNDSQLAPRYLASQEKEISHFGDMFRLLGDDSMHPSLRIWNTNTHLEYEGISLRSKVERGTQ